MAAAIDIFKDFPKDQYIPLVPVRTLSQLSPLHKMAVNLVQISTDENDKDVYKQGDGLALTKKGLMKLMAAANIQIVEIKKVAPSSCEKCLEMARATGKPSICATCPSKSDVAYEATLSVPDPAGGVRLVKGSREFICEDEKVRMTEAQYKQGFSFRGAMTESKAILRAIRAALMVKSSYKPQELNKTFVVPIVVPDLTDPEMKAAVLERYRHGADALYGGGMQQQALSAGTEVTSIEGDDEALDSAVDAEFTPQKPAAAEEVFIDAVVCQECDAIIEPFTDAKTGEWSVDRLVEFSMSKYGKKLCRACVMKTMKGAA